MLKISSDVKLDFQDVQLVPQFSSVSSRKLVKLTRNFTMPISKQVLDNVGIIAANMDGVGTFEVAKALASHKVMTALHKNYSVTQLVEFFKYTNDEDNVTDYTFYSMGISDSDYEKFNVVKKLGFVDKICIDVANGYMDAFYDYISRIRDENPFSTIMVGNVVTPEAVRKAYEHGADIVKLGIGPGAMCTTRLMTGVGYPQLSCIMESVQAADECGVFLCSDGGCSQPAHVAIAIAAGADFVMLGTMLAGTDEGGGELVDGKIQFYGMSSKTANEKHFGGLKNYRSSEGRTTMIPYKGSMDTVIQHILGGIASTCTYTGCRMLAELPFKATEAIRVKNTHNTAYEQYTVGF
ncbi:GMP reductase [Xanthomonas phage Xoo-sp13]|nr:GMP reductase [Xanthomonas phage Xoo-sp13]